MKRIIAILAIVGLGLAGFAGTCNLLNFSLTQVGANDVYGAQLQNNTGANFLAHKFKVAFVDGNGNVVDTKFNVDGCLRSWQQGASDYFSVKSTEAAATTANAIGALDFGQPLTAGTTVSTSATLSNLSATTPTLSSTNPTSATTTLTVKGTLKNNDSVTLAGANACAVVQGSSGQVVLTQKQALGDIAANGTNNFTISITVPNSTASVQTVTVWADGLENNVPTTPISGATGTNTGASKLAFTTQPPANTTGGAAFGVTVALQDSSGSTITTGSASTANVTLGLSGGTAGATLTCDQASNTMAGVAGVAAFTNCKIDKAGTGYTISASSTGATGATSTAVAVTAGAAAKLGFTTQPSASTVSGVAFAAQPVVAIQDAGGNTVTTGAASTATVNLSTFAGAATVTCTSNAVPAVAGIATFAGCSVDKTGSWTLRARVNTPTGISDGQSAAFAITPAAATHLVFTTAPSASTATGVAFAAQPVVAVEDAQGNVVTTSTAAITLTYSGTGTLACTTNPLAAVAGVASFAGCKVTGASTGNISATSSGLTAAPNVAITIT